VDLIKEKGEHKGRGRQDQKGPHVEPQGIADVVEPRGIRKKPDIVIQPHPFGSSETLEQFIVKKGNAHEPHGHIP
jgi:hypothetical protein